LQICQCIDRTINLLNNREFYICLENPYELIKMFKMFVSENYLNIFDNLTKHYVGSIENKYKIYCKKCKINTNCRLWPNLRRDCSSSVLRPEFRGGGVLIFK